MCSFRIDSWEHDCLQVAALELLLFKYILTHLEVDFVWGNNFNKGYCNFSRLSVAGTWMQANFRLDPCDVAAVHTLPAVKFVH